MVSRLDTVLREIRVFIHVPRTRPVLVLTSRPPARLLTDRTKTANVQEGDNVAIFGLGAVGLAVIQGCRVRKVKQIIAVDTNPSKEEWARKMGATDFVNPKELPEGKSIVDVLVDKTDGGCDHTLYASDVLSSFAIFSLTRAEVCENSDCTGNTDVMRQALEACHKGEHRAGRLPTQHEKTNCSRRFAGWGVSTIIGVAAAGKEISTRPFQLVTGRRWQGSAFGGVKGRTE